MSNRASICQETKTTRHNKQKQKVVTVFDDYGEGSIEVDKFRDKDLELLKKVVESVVNGICGDNVETIINNVRDNENGIFIEGTWYDWEEIKPILETMYDNNP